MDKRRIRKLGNKRLILLLVIGIFFTACKENPEPPKKEEIAVVEPQEVYEFGFKLNDFVVKKDTVRSGESFGEILERNKIGYPKIFHIAEKTKETYNIARFFQQGKPYTILCSKDSLELNIF